jgi:hypothetical protein
MGARYFVQPGFGPAYLQARYGNNAGTIQHSIQLKTTSSSNCFEIAEEAFTASQTDWYFIGMSDCPADADPGGGQTFYHEVWLKEVGGGDINLLAYGDFEWKVGEDKFNKITGWAAPPLLENGSIRNNEWHTGEWNMNKPTSASGVHATADWATLGNVLNELTVSKIANNAYTSLQLIKPAHP